MQSSEKGWAAAQSAVVDLVCRRTIRHSVHPALLHGLYRAEELTGDVTLTHFIQPQDTLAGICVKYGEKRPAGRWSRAR